MHPLKLNFYILYPKTLLCKTGSELYSQDMAHINGVAVALALFWFL